MKWPIVFNWRREDFGYLLDSCDKDEAVPYILKYLPRSWKILEAGCGLGRIVRYLSNKGYDVKGIEYGEETVRAVKEIDPELNVIQGDVLNMPYEANSMDGIISLGVIEHFIDGPDKPLREMYRVLKPGGLAIITVPSFNLVRKIKKFLYVDEINYFLNPVSIAKRSDIIRRFFKKGIIQEQKKFLYNRNKSDLYIYPVFGDFFEHRFTKDQFENILIAAGYTIIKSAPIAHIDGVYHEFGPLFVFFKNWKFFPNIMGHFLNILLSIVPFSHNHMHLCVVKKD